jgi:hypothetical protein
MKRRAGIHLALVGLALSFFSGHALAATLCNTGPAGPLGSNPPLSGKVTGGVVVNAGDLCVIVGANVSGGVKVNPGGVLVVCSSTINGGFTANGAAELIFGAEEIGCGGDSINGSVNISNTGPGILPPPAPAIALERSTLNGGVHLSGNAGMIAVASNTIAGGLFCSKNTFDVSDEDSPNIITGRVTCNFVHE